jgi:hypothetical protein
MTLDAIVSAIHGNIAAGLAGMPVAEYSVDQLADQVWLRRSLLVAQILQKSPALPGGYAQKFVFTPSLKRSEDLPGIGIPAGFAVAQAQIPVPMYALGDKTIAFFGAENETVSSRLYLDEDYRYHAQRLGAGRRAFGWADLTSRTELDGVVQRIECYTFLRKGDRPCRMVLRAFFDNAQHVASCASPDDAFPAPQDAIDAIIKSVTDEYIKMYRAGHYYGPRYAGRYQDQEDQPQQTNNQ